MDEIMDEKKIQPKGVDHRLESIPLNPHSTTSNNPDADLCETRMCPPNNVEMSGIMGFCCERIRARYNKWGAV